MTKTDRIQALKQRHSLELQRAEREENVRAALPALPQGIKWAIVAQKGETWAEPRSKRGDALPFGLLATLAHDLGEGAQPLRLEVSGNSRRVALGTARPGVEGDVRIARVVLDYSGRASYQRESVDVRWWIKLHTCGKVYTVRVSFPVALAHAPQGLGGFDQTYYPGTGRNHKRGDVKTSRLVMPQRLSAILCAKPERDGYHGAAALADSITWHRPHGAPGRALVFFHPLGENNPGPVDLVNTLAISSDEDEGVDA